MATALDIIKRALRVCHVLAAGETPEADDSTDALETLNAMLAEWYEVGIGLPDYSLATINTALVSDAADREAIALQLALRIVGEYETQIAPSDQDAAIQAMARLRLRYFQPGTVSTDLPTPYTAFDIEAG